MSDDVTALRDRIVEAAARAAWDASHPAPAIQWQDRDLPDVARRMVRREARAALAAAVREAGLDAGVVAMIAPACERLGARSEGMPRIEAGWRNTALLLRALAGIGDG